MGLREVGIKFPPIRISRTNLSHVDKQNDIQYELVRGVNPELFDLVRTDVYQFCRGKPAEEKKGTRIVYSDRIIPKTKIMIVNPERILTPGKQEFVPSCGLEANIDFGKGCPTGWIPGRDASFDGEMFTDYYLDPSQEC